MSNNYLNEEDRTLLEGLSNHQEEALLLIYKRFFPMILHMVVNNHGTEDDAKDLFQETMIVLYDKSKESGFILEVKLKTYLYAVAKNLWLKQLNQKNKTPFKPSEFDNEQLGERLADDIQDSEGKEERFKIMSEALMKLGEPCKSLLEHFYLQQMSMQEIAEKFGYTNPENAKTQKYKCLNRLKKLFFSQYKQSEIS
ncbi:MAG: RNA polymerase sigma factor [Chitinophagaceae bacterium]